MKNSGRGPGRAWVDVFVDLSGPPAIGTHSPLFRKSAVIAPGETALMWFAVSPSLNPTWVDVLVDTTRHIREVNENNNHEDALVRFLDCSFN